MREIKNTEILSFLKAKTPELLRESMLFNNQSKGKYFRYQDVQYVKTEKDAYWICWYQEDIINEIEKKVN